MAAEPGAAPRTSREAFAARFVSTWLPAFCDQPDRNRTVDGFRTATLDRLDEHDAHWFLQAMDGGFVEECGGYFTASRSDVKEQFVWTGSKNIPPRR